MCVLHYTEWVDTCQKIGFFFAWMAGAQAPPKSKPESFHLGKNRKSGWGPEETWCYQALEKEGDHFIHAHLPQINNVQTHRTVNLATEFDLLLPSFQQQALVSLRRMTRSSGGKASRPHNLVGVAVVKTMFFKRLPRKASKLSPIAGKRICLAQHVLRQSAWEMVWTFREGRRIQASTVSSVPLSWGDCCLLPAILSTGTSASVCKWILLIYYWESGTAADEQKKERNVNNLLWIWHDLMSGTISPVNQIHSVLNCGTFSSAVY